MVATTMTLMVLGAASYIMIMAAHTQPAISDRSFDIQQGRTFEDRFTRELRASYKIEPVPPPTASVISLDTYVRSATCGGAPQTNPAVPAIAAGSPTAVLRVPATGPKGHRAQAAARDQAGLRA